AGDLDARGPVARARWEAGEQPRVRRDARMADHRDRHRTRRRARTLRPRVARDARRLCHSSSLARRAREAESDAQGEGCGEEAGEIREGGTEEDRRREAREAEACEAEARARRETDGPAGAGRAPKMR